MFFYHQYPLYTISSMGLYLVSEFFIYIQFFSSSSFIFSAEYFFFYFLSISIRTILPNNTFSSYHQADSFRI